MPSTVLGTKLMFNKSHLVLLMFFSQLPYVDFGNILGESFIVGRSYSEPSHTGHNTPLFYHYLPKTKPT